MTDTTPETEDETVQVELRLYPDESEDKALRQVGLGLQPLIILEAEPAADGEGTVLVVTGSLIDTHDELLATLEGFVEATRAALEQHRGNEAAGFES